MKRGRIMWGYEDCEHLDEIVLCEHLTMLEPEERGVKLHILTPDELRDELKAAWDACRLVSLGCTYSLDNAWEAWYDQHLKERG